MSTDNFAGYYDRHAAHYAHRFKSGEMPFHDQLQLPLFRSYLGAGHYSRCLDAGCGIGYYSDKVAERCDRVVGIDVSDAMLGIARSETTRPNVEYVKCDLLKFEPSAPFDLAVAGFMPSYFEDASTFFRKMASLMNSGGILLTSTLHPVRMAASNRTSTGYVVSEYLKPTLYESDFLSSDDPLHLHRHTFSSLHNAAQRAGFVIERMDEPPAPAKGNSTASTFHKWNPSIVTYKMRKASYGLDCQ